MGKSISKLNPFRNFNIDRRVEKVLTKDKPMAAPKYKYEVQDYEQVMKGNVQAEQKHQQLSENLRNVYVKSFDPKVEEHKYSQESYPQDRGAAEDYLFGFKEPTKVPKGKMLLKDALKYINNHQAKPSEFNFKEVSDKFLIPEEKIRTIFKYFKVFEVHMPDKSGTRFAERSRPRVEVKIEDPKQLEGPKES